MARYRTFGFIVLLFVRGAALAQEASAEGTDFVEVAQAIGDRMRAHIYDASALETPSYQKMETQLLDLSRRAGTREEFISEFNRLWRDGPFSHVRLDVARQSAEELAEFLDGMKVGGGGAALTWSGEVAVLTVNTMMGLDTIEQIEAAYHTIHARKAQDLIIDLRNNEGGAFAVKPLVSHVIASNLDAGVFLSQRWTRQNRGAPSPEEVQKIEPWRGWSLKTFWRDVQNEGITRIVFEPAEPRFDGRVYVLTSRRTASAAELATDALLASGRVTVVGERTAGEMLSQKMHDLPGGMQLFLPIADYYAAHSGRIEGSGVKPTVQIESEKALDKALGLARDR